MYLGTATGSQVLLPSSDLTTHAVVLGRTGSGKTGLVSVLVEEAVSEGAAAIIFDPKGDLANLAIRPSEDQHLRDWGGDMAHWDSLARFGYSKLHAAHWRARCTIDVYTPGGPKPVNVFPTFAPPACPSQEMAARDVGLMLTAIRGKAKSDDMSDLAMTRALLAHWTRGIAFPIREWPHYLSEGIFEDKFHQDFFGKKQRMTLAKTLLRFLHESGRWVAGPSLDPAAIVAEHRVVILSMRHLDEEARQTFTSAALARVVDYMGKAPSSSGLKLMVVLDEARGYLPPHPANPPAKGPICTLLAQGRASGIGLVIGTQNPMDLDYKALSNVGTWFVGRLRARDCARDLLSELRDRGVEADAVESQPERGFLLLPKSGEKKMLSTRHALSLLRGPMTPEEISRI